jgi:ABC-type branched-subunit amino acid transport system substrate-binding protein
MLKKLALVFATLLMLVVALPIASCKSSSDEIKLGAVMDITGALSGIGSQIRDGVQLAVNQINAAGGIDGKKVTLYVEDGQTDATAGFEAVKKLVEVNGCKVIIGPMISGATKASGEYALQKKVLLISPSATSPEIATQLYRQFVFRTVPSDTLQGTAMAQLVTEGGYKKVALLVVNNSYGAGMADVLIEKLAGKATIVANVQYDLTKLDYLTELQTIKDKAPDCVIHVGYGDDAKIVYKQALQLGLSNAQWIAPEGVYADATLSVAESAQFMASSVIGTRPTAPEGLAAFSTFATAYKTAFGADPGVYCDGAYDAANLVFAAMKVVGSTDGTKIAAEVLKLAKNYAGASGSITLNQNGDRVSGDYEVWKVVKNGSTYSYAKVKIIKL